MDEILKILSDFKKQLEEVRKAFTVYVQGWTAPSFSNSWVNFDGTANQCGYMRDPHGFVHLRGKVKTGTINTAIFTLPANYRPQYVETFVGISNDAVCKIEVETDGDVIPVTGNNTYVSLDGITFKAYQ